MTMTRAGWLAMGGAVFETAAWLLFVPTTSTASTFLILNGLAVIMFCVGFASAAKGLSTRSVTQLLHDLEKHPG